ncbi:MAG TPA: carboxypeptidase-like regulatory domain-containing protein, partial [Vicinamibacteria bacterium]
GTRSATTGSTGAYTLAGVPNGSLTLTPSRAGFTFSPPSLSVTVNGANLTGRDFTATGLPTRPLLEAHFDAGNDGFVYLDDAFRGTAQPSFASGGRLATGGVSGGALAVAIGGINDATILNMSGGWRVAFNMPVAGPARVTFAYKLTQTAEYESDERSQVLATLDGAFLGAAGVVAELVGNGNGGLIITTGFRTFQVDVPNLAAGQHVLAIGGFNSQKNMANEATGVVIDDVRVLGP